MREDTDKPDGATILTIALLVLVVIGPLGFSIWDTVKHNPNPDAILIIESHGYTKVDVWGRDQLNCPAHHGSTSFRAYTDTSRVRGVLCTQIYGDSIFVRVLEEY